MNPVATTDEYRGHAAECLDSARSVADVKAKLELLDLAKGYLDLADLVEGSASERDVPVRKTDQGVGNGVIRRK